MIITLYIILFYYEKVVVKFYNCIKQIIKKDYKKVVVKFYNCIKQIIKKDYKKVVVKFYLFRIKITYKNITTYVYYGVRIFFNGCKLRQL